MDSSEEELDGHSLSQLEANNLELHVELLLHLSLQDKLFSGMNFPSIFWLEMDLPKPIDDGLDLMKKRKGKKKKKKVSAVRAFIRALPSPATRRPLRLL
ncbi:hypothetical protein FCV25MIE_27644, partial [Fagus crenata]